jgi:hypothetical protein
MYGHEVLMSLQKRTKLFGTHFSSEVAVNSICAFVRSCRPTFRMAYNEFRLVDSRSVAYYGVMILAKSPRYCSGETQNEKHNLLRLLES